MNKGITIIKFPNTLQYIGDYAFAWNNLIEVIIPNSVTEIGTESFNGNNISNVEIGTDITSIGEGVFDNNPLVTVNIKSNPTLAYRSFHADNYLGGINGFQTFQYDGTCEELNQYDEVLFFSYKPQTIITSDTNSCEYTKFGYGEN